MIVAQVVSVLVAFMLAVLLWKSVAWVLSPNVGFEQVITTGWAKWPFFLVVPVWAATSLKRRLGYDDSLDVFGIHGVGGLAGALLTGVFASTSVNATAGLIEGNPGQVVTQIYGVLATVLWCAAATFVILKLVDGLLGLRVGRESEIEGLDINLHGEVVP